MSLARAITRRTKRTEVPSSSPPARSQSVKIPTMQIDRSKISLPVALVSTTNMLSYNAPDIAGATTRHASSSTVSSHSSADDSDHSASTVGSRDTALTDASSVESSPTSPAPNHLSGYFPGGKQLQKSTSTKSLSQVREEIVESVPVIPQRAVSHSKRAHERLAAKRSLNNIGSHGSQGPLRNSRERRASIDMFNPTITEEAHPFGRELEQLNEIAEEFGGAIRDAEAEADLSAMRTKNLAAYCAAEYLSDIRPLFNNRFGLAQQAPPMAWI